MLFGVSNVQTRRWYAPPEAVIAPRILKWSCAILIVRRSVHSVFAHFYLTLSLSIFYSPPQSCILLKRLSHVYMMTSLRLFFFSRWWWCPCLCCCCSRCWKLIYFLRLVVSVHVWFLSLSIVRHQLIRVISTVLLHPCRASFASSLPRLLVIVLFTSISLLILILDYHHLVTFLTIVLVSRLRPLVREEERERNLYVYMCMKKKLKINLNWFFDI